MPTYLKNLKENRRIKRTQRIRDKLLRFVTAGSSVLAEPCKPTQTIYAYGNTTKYGDISYGNKISKYDATI